MLYRASKNGPQLVRQNDKKDWQQRVEELYAFLRGERLPDKVTMRKDRPRLSAKAAANVLWFLQECSEVFPDNYEVCSGCDAVYDSYKEGAHDENTGKCYCGQCAPATKED